MTEANRKPQTSQETAMMLKRLADMDGTPGIFGEPITDEELDSVAGGNAPRTYANLFAPCLKCGKEIPYGAGVVKKPQYHTKCWKELMNALQKSNLKDKDPISYFHQLEALERASYC